MAGQHDPRASVQGAALVGRLAGLPAATAQCALEKRFVRARARGRQAGGYVAEGRVNGSLNLSRALGDMEYKQSAALGPEAQIVTAVPEVGRPPPCPWPLLRRCCPGPHRRL